MAVTFSTTVGTTIYGFDWTNQQITIDAATVSIVAEDLKTAIHDAQDEGPTGVVFNQIANFGNPVILTPSSSTFLNVLLRESWKILSLATSGSFTVGEGNTVSIADGIDIFSINTLVTLVNNTSAAGVLVTSPSAVVTPSQQEIRDAMKLAPSGGAAASGSLDDQIDNIEDKTKLHFNLEV